MQNHKSLGEHAERCHREYERLQKKGKVTLFPSGDPKPEKLHVSPCAAVITEKLVEANGRDLDEISWEEKTPGRWPGISSGPRIRPLRAGLRSPRCAIWKCSGWTQGRR